MTSFESEFEKIMVGQFPTAEHRFAMLAADPEVLTILNRIPPDKNNISHEDYLALERVAIDRYGVSTQEAFKLVVDYWQGRQMTEGSSHGQ
jgi:hypothetical protein